MAKPPPPTRDFQGPFLFVGALVGVALLAFALLIYAASVENRTQFDPQSSATSVVGGALADNGVDNLASLWVDGVPYGATLLVNTDSVGTVPMTIDDLPAGDHLLTLEADGRALDTLISVGAGETAAVFLRLDVLGDVSGATVEVAPDVPVEEQLPTSPEASQATVPPASATGILRVLSQPAGATVQLDGVPVGTTPLALPTVTAGRHTVTATLAGRESREMSVDVAAGRDQMVRLSLPAVAGPGTLEVLARPWGTIYIDGALKKRNTDVVYRAELPAGTHEIRVVHPTFGTRTRQVTIRTGQTVMEVFDLTVGSTDDGS